MFALRLPGGRAITAIPVSSRSSPLRARLASPPPKRRGNIRASPALTWSYVARKRARISRSIFRIAVLSVSSASERSSCCASRYAFCSGELLVLADGGEVDRTQPGDSPRHFGELRLPCLLARLPVQAAQQVLHVESLRLELLLQRLAADHHFLCGHPRALQDLPLLLAPGRTLLPDPFDFRESALRLLDIAASAAQVRLESALSFEAGLQADLRLFCGCRAVVQLPLQLAATCLPGRDAPSGLLGGGAQALATHPPWIQSSGPPRGRHRARRSSAPSPARAASGAARVLPPMHCVPGRVARPPRRWPARLPGPPRRCAADL